MISKLTLMVHKYWIYTISSHTSRFHKSIFELLISMVQAALIRKYPINCHGVTYKYGWVTLKQLLISDTEKFWKRIVKELFLSETYFLFCKMNYKFSYIEYQITIKIQLSFNNTLFLRTSDSSFA